MPKERNKADGYRENPGAVCHRLVSDDWHGCSLQNAGKDVDFLLAWNRPHSGDYALDELFEWMNKITK